MCSGATAACTPAAAAAAAVHTAGLFCPPLLLVERYGRATFLHETLHGIRFSLRSDKAAWTHNKRTLREDCSHTNFSFASRHARSYLSLEAQDPSEFFFSPDVLASVVAPTGYMLPLLAFLVFPHNVFVRNIAQPTLRRPSRLATTASDLTNSAINTMAAHSYAPLTQTPVSPPSGRSPRASACSRT